MRDIDFCFRKERSRENPAMRDKSTCTGHIGGHMNSAFISTIRKSAVVLGLFLFAIVALASLPNGKAQAQGAFDIQVTKVCVGATGPFTVGLHTTGTIAPNEIPG